MDLLILNLSFKSGLVDLFQQRVLPRSHLFLKKKTKITYTNFLNFQGLRATDIDGVIEEVLDPVQRNTNEYIFYFHGWKGYGTTAFLSYMARVLPSMKDPPPGCRFGKIVYLDCSMWGSKRTMQRKLGEELKLEHV